MPGTRSPARSARTVVLAAALVAAALAATGCGAKHRLGEYDFRSRTLAVVTIAPPRPEVFSSASLDVDPDNPLESVLRVGSEIAREAEAHRLRSRLDSAAADVDVSARMGERALRNAARHLRATPVPETRSVDFELELRVRHYGIVASSWTSGAYFSVDADVLLLDGSSGRRIWNTRVRARDPVRPTVTSADHRAVTNVVTAIALASMSVEEIRHALEALADFAADAVVAQLAEDLDDARG